MKIIEQNYDVRTGKTELREIERPDVISPAEASRRQPAIEREARLVELRAEMQAILIEHALGVDVTARIQKLREEYQSL